MEIADNKSIVGLVQAAIASFEYSTLKKLVRPYSDEYRSYIYNHLKSDREKGVFENLCM